MTRSSWISAWSVAENPVCDSSVSPIIAGAPGEPFSVAVEAQVGPEHPERLHVGVARLDPLLDPALGELVRVDHRRRLAHGRSEDRVGPRALVASLMGVARSGRGDVIRVRAAVVDRLVPEADRERREGVGPGARRLVEPRRARLRSRSRPPSSSRSPRPCSPRGSRGRIADRSGICDGKIVGWLIWVKPPAAWTWSKISDGGRGAP